jgi:hypothetical protein
MPLVLLFTASVYADPNDKPDLTGRLTVICSELYRLSPALVVG